MSHFSLSLSVDSRVTFLDIQIKTNQKPEIKIIGKQLQRAKDL